MARRAGRPLASYHRSGGRPPADDERLEIDEDGGWRLWRTMGGAAVGSYAGRLPADGRRRLAEAIASASDAGAGRGRGRPAPDGATEAVQAGDARLDIESGSPVAGGWQGVVRLLRRWTESLATAGNADAGLALVLVGDGQRLVRHGQGPLRIWPATLHVERYGRDADSVVRERAVQGVGADGEGPVGEPITTGDGWALDLELPDVVRAPAGGRVEAWAWLDVDGPDGRTRVRLVAGRPA